MFVYENANAQDFWNRVDARLTGTTNRAWLCRQTGTPESTLSSAIKRGVWPKVDVAVRIADVLGVDVHTLVTGKERSILSYAANDPYEYRGEEVPSVVIPLLSSDPTASRKPPQAIRIPQGMVEGIETRTLSAIVIKGDAMEAMQMHAGDIAVFSHGAVGGNGLYAITLRKETSVRRLEFRQGERLLYIHSENEKYSVEKVPMDDKELTIMGRIVGWLHRI